MAFKINHLHFKTPNPQKTARWYVENLGAEIVEEIRGGETVGFRLDLLGLRLNVTGFVEGQKLEQHYGMEHLAIDTDDLPGIVEKLKASGARILEERQLRDGRHVCFFEGPEGVRLEVMEMRK
jgi:catechol 2,3-dioxygenase-like lactoylglutathione lyase family enzyme